MYLCKILHTFMCSPLASITFLNLPKYDHINASILSYSILSHIWRHTSICLSLVVLHRYFLNTILCTCPNYTFSTRYFIVILTVCGLAPSYYQMKSMSGNAVTSSGYTSCSNISMQSSASMLPSTSMRELLNPTAIPPQNIAPNPPNLTAGVVQRLSTDSPTFLIQVYGLSEY